MEELGFNPTSFSCYLTCSHNPYSNHSCVYWAFIPAKLCAKQVVYIAFLHLKKMSYDSQTIEFTLFAFKVYTSVDFFFFWYISKVVQSLPLSNSTIFSTPLRETLSLLAVTFYSTLSLSSDNDYSTSCLSGVAHFEPFHINGITKYVAYFCIWLLSFGLMFPSFIQVVVSVNISFLSFN